MEIVAKNLCLKINEKTPLEKTILENVSFEIKEKGIYTFLGSSNSGKTALGDLINALIKPSKGSIKVLGFINNGRRIKKVNKLRFETGYVFKNPYDMFFNKTVKEELEFGMKYFKYKLDKLQLRTIDALKLVGLNEEYFSKSPFSLSLSDAKKVALACVLIYNPKIIILDEITAGLGHNERLELVRLLKRLKNNYNKTIILLSKDTAFTHQISDYIYIMDKCRIVEEGKREILYDTLLLSDISLEVPPMIEFISEARKKGINLHDQTEINDLLKEVYRNVF